MTTTINGLTAEDFHIITGRRAVRRSKIRRDDQKDALNIAASAERASRLNMSISQYVTACINTAHRRKMANTGEPITQMSVLVY